MTNYNVENKTEEVPVKKKNKTSFTINYKLLTIGIIVLALAGFFYLAYDGYFKSEVNQEVSLEPENNINVDNAYDFKPVVNNDYNLTLLPNYTINIYLDGDILNGSE